MRKLLTILLLGLSISLSGQNMLGATKYAVTESMEEQGHAPRFIEEGLNGYDYVLVFEPDMVKVYAFENNLCVQYELTVAGLSLSEWYEVLDANSSIERGSGRIYYGDGFTVTLEWDSDLEEWKAVFLPL